MYGPNRSGVQEFISAPSRRMVPCSGFQTPTSRRAKVDLPAALGPMIPKASPAAKAKPTSLMITLLVVRIPNDTFSRAIWPVGAGSSIGSIARRWAFRNVSSRL